MLFGETVAVYLRTIRNTQMYINPVRASQETRHVSATKLNRLMLFGETVAVYCENHTEHTDTLCDHENSHYEMNISLERYRMYYGTASVV
jgi:hypothetical protein